MIAFTDPLFLVLAFLTWAGTVGWTYGITRLLIRRSAPIVSYSRSHWVMEQAITCYVMIGSVMWFVVVPFLSGVGEVAITLEGYICLHIGLVFVLPGMGLAYKAEHVKTIEPEPREDPNKYPWIDE